MRYKLNSGGYRHSPPPDRGTRGTHYDLVGHGGRAMPEPIYKKGDRVQHPQWGIGTVKAYKPTYGWDPPTYYVRFDEPGAPFWEDYTYAAEDLKPVIRNPRKKNPRKFAVGDLVSHVNGYPKGYGTVTEVAEYVGRRDQSVTVKWPPQEFKETYSSSALTLVKKNPGGKRRNPAGFKKFIVEFITTDPEQIKRARSIAERWRAHSAKKHAGGVTATFPDKLDMDQAIQSAKGWGIPVTYGERRPRKKNPLTSGLGDTYVITHANPRSLPVKSASFPRIRHTSGWHTYRLVQRLSGERGTDKSAVFFAPDDTAARNHAARVLFDGARAIRLERAA